MLEKKLDPWQKSQKQCHYVHNELCCKYGGMIVCSDNERPGEDHRPWGYYCVLSDETDHKVKRIVVYPQQRLSLQRHHRRREHWYIVRGEAVVTIDGKHVRLKDGEVIDIPEGAWHRIMNTGHVDLVFIEVQTGNYFGEDDIERLEDDYGRL